jgi:ABC-type anion transport system duplicated permease subunit
VADVAAGLIAPAVAVVAAAVLSGLAALLPFGGFVALVLACVGLWLPTLAMAVLFGPVFEAGSLTILLFPVLAWGWRRLPRGQWRTARSLGAPPARIVRRLVVPSMLPFFIAAVLLAGFVFGVRAHLHVRPRSLFLPDPVTATG